MAHLFLASALLLAVPPASQEIDRAALAALDLWKVPGLALVIVHGDRVVHLKGYGVESLESKTPTSPDTIFPLASCTKPFTATLLAALVDDGKLAWNDPVRKHLPYFRLKDPFANERATLRDLLCHRTGLGAHDMLWYRSALPIEERVRKLALLDPVCDFRTEFHYQTIAFGAAGLAGERAAGRPWAELMTERIFRPLGMASSSAAEPAGTKTLASPHRLEPDGRVKRIPRYSLVDADPAGSVHSTARDLAAFLRLQLKGGVHDGKPLVSRERIRDIQQPNVVVPCEGFTAKLNPATTQISYGLGWIVQDYRGHKLILHGGAIDGFRAHLALLPDSHLGIGILSNLDGSLANFALANTLADLFLDLPPRPWNDEIFNLIELDRKADIARATTLRKNRPANARPRRPLADYVGDYADQAYGPCRVELENRGLLLKWGEKRCPLEHYLDDLFIGNSSPFNDASFEFEVGEKGNVASVKFLGRTFGRK